jgi:hypothetical protein
MNLSVVRYKKEHIVAWNAFLPSARNGLFLFNRGYMDYHQDRFSDHSLMIYKGEKLVAVFPANEKEKKIYSHAGLTYGGIVSSNELKGADMLNVLNLVTAYYKENNITELTYKAIPYIFSTYPCQEDLYALTRCDAVLYRRDISSVIDLAEPLRFSETKRQSVNKCRQLGLTVEDNSDFTTYWELLRSVLSKHKAEPVHTLNEINSLKQNFPDKIKLFEARLNGELLAGVVIYDYGKVVHTQYMANSEKGRDMGALDYINSKLISENFKDRRYYSFGISTEQEGKVLNEGLLQQKEMMGARAIVNDFYKIII